MYPTGMSAMADNADNNADLDAVLLSSQGGRLSTSLRFISTGSSSSYSLDCITRRSTYACGLVLDSCLHACDDDNVRSLMKKTIMSSASSSAGGGLIEVAPRLLALSVVGGESTSTSMLRWNLPLGVMHDATVHISAETANGVLAQNKTLPVRSSNSSWTLQHTCQTPNLHAQHEYPAQIYTRSMFDDDYDNTSALAPTRQAFFMALKEACFCTVGNTQAVAGLAIAKQDAAFQAALEGDAHKYADATSEVAKLMREGAWEKSRRIPLRVVALVANEGGVPDGGAGSHHLSVVSRAASIDGDGAPRSLRDAVQGAIRDTSLSSFLDGKTTTLLVVGGLALPNSTACELSVWQAWRSLRDMDGFLYVCLKAIASYQ